MEQVDACEAIHIFTTEQYLDFATTAPELFQRYLGLSDEKFDEILEIIIKRRSKYRRTVKEK